MPTKTDRILSYLPGTFLALPRPTALYSVADAFGNELLQAENTLVAVMRSHWVDTADQGDEIIDDLARIASLYGLAPRDDETVEDFRAHLKRYVRTFLEGTPTVQGALRLTAEALALLIADSYEQMDTWWTRPQPDAALVTNEPQGNDASGLLFAPTALTARGSASQPARISGTADLSGGVDLRAASKLALEINGAAAVVIDLGSLPGDLSAARLSDIVTAINTKLAPQVVASASPDGKRLILSSPSLGAASELKVEDVAGDAAPVLLGLRPRTYAGTKDVSAQVVGTIDLQGGVDLSVRRYLRLLIDGTHLAEIDCTGSSPSATKLNDIRDAINNALGLTVASHDGHFLTLTSPTTGFSSVIQFQAPAAQDATQTLFGPVNGIYTGKSAQPAVVAGSQDLSRGIDLSGKFNIEFALDGGAHLLVNCAGANPAATGLDEIVAAINTAAGLQIASQDGRFITLTSPMQGPGSSIQFFSPVSADATFEIFGLTPRQAAGQAASAATLQGLAIAGGTLDLAAQHLLRVAVDGGAPAVVDFWKSNGNLRAVTLGEIAQAINAGVAPSVASNDGQHLILTSSVVGASSSVAVVPLEQTIRRRFVTRAFVTDEASQKTLGVFQKVARGAAATPARVEGTAELSRGVDLRNDPFLQLKIDGGPAMTIDCSAGVPRPRVALPADIVAAINAQIDDGHSQVASTDGHHLFFTSPTTGAGSSIEFQPVLASDALSTLGLAPTTVFGRDAARVSFLGTVDLSAGVDLSAASKIKLAIDGAAPVEIDCAGPDPAHTTLSQIVTRINTPLNTSIATAVGKTIALTSPSSGAKSKIEFVVPSSNDATQLIFGVGARAYQGEDARPPRVTGSEIKDAATGVDLHLARFLSVGVDGGKVLDIDSSAGAADATKVKLAEIIAAINKAVNRPMASSPDGKRLTLTGPTATASGKLTLDTVASGGAFARLMGSAEQTTRGADPAPATIAGTVDLLAGADLDERRILRLAVDGARPLDIDISGAQPDKTFLDEIVAKVNAVVPGVASASADDHLVLTSPTRGEESRLEVLPIRVLEVQEFSPAEAEQNFSLQPGDRFSVNNQGAADSELTIEIQAPQGVAGAELVNRSAGVRIRVLDAVPAGGLLKLWNDASGLKAVIVTSQGKKLYVPDSHILVGPLGSQALVPFSGAWRLSGGAAGSRATLQLNNSQASSITVVEARRRGLQGSKISVKVAEAALPPLPAVTADGSRASLVGRLRFTSGAFSLVDSNNALRASLRAAAGVALGPTVDQVVLVQGRLFPSEGGAPVMVVESAVDLFDVTIEGTADDGNDLVETYAGASIGSGASDPYSLVFQILSKPSELVVAEELGKSSALKLSRGRSDWSYLAASGSRFDYATFNQADFAGGPCLEQGVFDASRFSYMPPEPEAAVFAGPVTDPPVQVKLRWRNYDPGSFVVNLPADLPENFGGRFNQARFALPGEAPEVYGGVVMEPQNDKDYITTRINQSSSANPKSTLVKAATVDHVPLGWEPMPMPFHHPRSRPLTGGTDTDPAAIYLAEPGVPGFIELTALAPGKWGNTIEVTARKASPGRFDITVGYQAARFENARQIVFAGRILAPGEDPLPALTDEVLKPRPVGVVQGKAAGVLAQVTRDGTTPAGANDPGTESQQ